MDSKEVEADIRTLIDGRKRLILSGAKPLPLTWDDALSVIASLQLALRHPQIPKETSRIVRDVLDNWLTYISITEREMADVLKKGFLAELNTKVCAASESTWEVTSGRATVGRPVCPRCGGDVPRAFLGDRGIGGCPLCGARVAWQAGPSPAGFSWLLWSTDDEQSHSA